MARLPIDIRAMLLKSGKEQFLAHGFEKASLRTICKEAGLTTGAFYNHFSGKEDLFAALVEPMLRGFQNMYREVISQELSDLSTGTDNELTSITYAVAHKDEFRLLFECSGGTKYEGFREHLIHEVKIILHMKFEEYMELIYGGYTMEEVKKLIVLLTAFSEAGFHKLIEVLDSEEMNKES